MKSLHIDDELHRRLRLKAAGEGTNLRTEANEAIRAWVRYERIIRMLEGNPELRSQIEKWTPAQLDWVS